MTRAAFPPAPPTLPGGDRSGQDAKAGVPGLDGLVLIILDHEADGNFSGGIENIACQSQLAGIQLHGQGAVFLDAGSRDLARTGRRDDRGEPAFDRTLELTVARFDPQVEDETGRRRVMADGAAPRRRTL